MRHVRTHGFTVYSKDQPHPDLRSLSTDETMDMSKCQIKNWLAYREGVEQGINDTNQIELKKVAESLRNRMFNIIKNVLPNDDKDRRLRFRLKKNLRHPLEHNSRLPGMGKEVHDILNIHPWPTALTKVGLHSEGFPAGKRTGTGTRSWGPCGQKCGRKNCQKFM